MAFLGGVFDATKIQPDAPFEVIPAGSYLVMIVDSEMTQTKSGNGQILKLQLQVIDGPHQGATLFDRLNIVNPNTKAEEIAQRTLSAICHAVGKLQVQDSADLHNIPLVAVVKIRPAEGEYSAQNEIKGYKPAGSASAQQAATPFQPRQAQAAQAFAPQAAPAQAPSQTAAASVPPWMAGKIA